MIEDIIASRWIYAAWAAEGHLNYRFQCQIGTPVAFRGALRVHVRAVAEARIPEGV